MAAVESADDEDIDQPTDPQLPSTDSRASNPDNSLNAPNAPNPELSLSKLAPPPDDDINKSKESLISPSMHTDDDYSDEEDIDQNHNRSGTMSFNEKQGFAEEEEYDVFEERMMGSHRRTGSMAERREEISRQKEAMERKLRSLSQNLDQGLDAALGEFQEMERINADKQVFGDLFDRIDPEENGDVDEKEWVSGLQRLHVQMEAEDMAKLFVLMDGDRSGYIDRQDWVTFCLQHYESKELQRLHDAVLRSVKGHSRKPSNMIHAQDVGQWSAAAVSSLEKQMTEAVIGLGSKQLHQAEEEEEYILDIQQQAEQDPDWAKAERALDWSPKEVAFWLDSIELSQYARVFDEEDVDGSILLNDCDRNMLQTEMGIKVLHCGKILRELDKLRALNKDQLQSAYRDWNELTADNEALSEKLLAANQAIKELEAQNAELRLKTINAVNPNLMMNPMMSDDVGDATTRGLDDDDDLMGLTDSEPDSERVRRMQDEIHRLREQKIVFAENAAEEICKLNRIVRALSTEYTTLTTPYFERFNPMDSIIRSLGYQPTQQQ